MEIRGIDVSEWQGDIDFAKVKASGIQFAILRAGYGIGNMDAKFEANYRKAKAVGLPVGAYWFSYADSADAAKLEAESFANALKGKQLEYPAYYDLERQTQLNKGKAFCTSLVETFCGALEAHGIYAGLYTGVRVITKLIEPQTAKKYALWIAQYYKYCQYDGHGMWQYSSSGKVDGIKGNVDMDICYVDYPKIIKSEGDEMTRWNKISDVPEGYYRTKAQEYIDKGIIGGKGDGVIDLTEDMLRSLIFTERMLDKAALVIK